MRRSLVSLGLAVACLASPVLMNSAQAFKVSFAGAAKQELLTYLQNYNAFTAKFTLKATDPKGKVLNEQSGELRAQKPSNLYLHQTSPVENYLAVYNNQITYYDPFVEQVTISALDKNKPMPFLYLLNTKSEAWDNVSVQKADGCYDIQDSALKQSYKSLRVCLNDGNLTEFSYVEANGNQASYKFSNFTVTSLGADSFKVNYPANAKVTRK
ncbi:outer membrane lipoprotein chaperone LolA [Psittacicella hinzii]|uniref:Outer-membrane lipoprotein carrier protein n=1 Tax=Psittacicella hinzii TaxID=2028575 RepID=A0A3A1YSV1_9GAMM|nr:outer membrane lipoprotein chaperone LolA [Psittacicella hinzii]RIY40000.1 outer membrane lipoprotein carrier protein LolA [Psittacicella hinzii]